MKTERNGVEETKQDWKMWRGRERQTDGMRPNTHLNQSHSCDNHGFHDAVVPMATGQS